MSDSMDAAPSQKSSIGVQSPEFISLPASVRHTDAFSGVASGRLVVGSTPMLPDLFADEPLSLAARERVRHEWLMMHVPMDRQVLRKWLNAGFLEKHAYFATTEGTPQGGCLPPALANWTLDGLQRLLAEHFTKTLKQQRMNKTTTRGTFLLAAGGLGGDRPTGSEEQVATRQDDGNCESAKRKPPNHNANFS